MAFRFPLQSVLRLRRSVERQEEQRLFAIAAIVARLRAQQEQLEREQLAARRAASAEMQDGVSGAVVQFAAVCEQAARETQVQLRTQLAEAEQRRLEQLAVYIRARQTREVFESIRERQEASYAHELARRDQARSDDQFLSRFRVSPDG